MAVDSMGAGALVAGGRGGTGMDSTSTVVGRCAARHSHCGLRRNRNTQSELHPLCLTLNVIGLRCA